MRANTDRSSTGLPLVTDRGYSPSQKAIDEYARAMEADALLASAEPEYPTDVVCLASRMTAGLGVQALYVFSTGECAVTVTLNGETETFSVPRAELMAAFNHPYAYGATLDLS